MQTHCGSEPCVLLVGNKLDLVSKSGANRAVPIDRVQKFAKENNMLYVETSAVTHQNVKEAFLTLLSVVAAKSGSTPGAVVSPRLGVSKWKKLKPRFCR